MIRRTALTMIVGAFGGCLFWYLRMPLPWMLGATIATTAVALVGGRLAVDLNLRNFMVAVIGVLLGSTFTPALLGRVADWLGSVAMLVIYVPAAIGVTYVYLRRVARFDATTAFFGAAPGGLNEMILMGEAMGGDVRTIALLHSIRIVVAVFGISFFFRYVLHLTVPAFMPSIAAAPGIIDLGILLACALLGIALGRRLKFPAAALITPMAISATVHLLGLTSSQPPSDLVAIAQVVIGSSIGARFVGLPLRALARTSGHAIVATLLMLGMTGLFAVLLSAVSPVPTAAAMLSLAPGGVTEMSLIALALGVDAAYVATMHLSRLFTVLGLSPLIWRAVRKPDSGPT